MVFHICYKKHKLQFLMSSFGTIICLSHKKYASCETEFSPWHGTPFHQYRYCMYGYASVISEDKNNL